MKRILFTILFVLLLTGVSFAGAIATAAGTLSAGQWTKLTQTQMPGLNLTAQTYDPAAPAPGIFYDGNQPGWDSTAQKLYMEMAEHAGASGDPCNTAFNTCWKPLWTYTESTSTWTANGAPPVYSNGTRVDAGHSYDHVAWDDVHKVMYVKRFYANTANVDFFRYCVNASPSYCATQGAGTWTNIASLFPPSEAGQQSMAYHPNLNGGTLVYFTGSGGGSFGCGAVFGHRETGGAGTWSTLDAGTACKFKGNNEYGKAIYSPGRNMVIFGGGESTTAIWTINAAGTITQRDNAPCLMGTSNGIYVSWGIDPANGDLIAIGCTHAGQLWRFNPTAAPGSQWSMIDGNLSGVGEICETNHPTENCSAYFVASTISTYGVIAYWKFLNTSPLSAEFWLYKPSTGGGDITPPTVSVTAPTAGATVSGAAVTLSATASDNFGVVGVQFKVDGVATGTEDVTSPYSISWNSTPVSDGAHTITATARDAAGNTTTSAAVNVTVSNNTTASFAARCAAAGVLFCNGFDSAPDLGGDGWGSARGRGPADGTQFCGANNCPTIDTTVKVSGAGALKLTIPPGANGNSAGAYWANPAADFSVRFGAGQTYYVQFRQRITASYFPAILVDNDKIHWVSTTPDLPGCSTSNTTNCFASCTPNELVNQNYYGVASDAFPRWYNGCPVPANNTFGLIEPVAIGQYKLQNARTGVGCTYDNVSAGNIFPPKGNCFPYYPDQWVTYSYKISLGSLGTGAVGGTCYTQGGQTPNLPNCYYGNQIQARMGLDGQPLEEVLNWTLPLSAGDQAVPKIELKYGKVYFAPYTGGATIASGASMWFDELIISTQPIADPSATPDTTIPTVAITSPIPPSASTTTSPISVSGTATDNIGVTSVTWTCLNCVTKGGTATSSPGTSISWLIPALDLVGPGPANVVNVVAHDAAGNASVAATLIITYTPSPVYWVRPTGTMSGCTPSTTAPALDSGYKSTVAAGLSCLAGGNTLYIRAGTYHERILYTQLIPSGTVSAPTTISNYLNEMVWLDGTNGATTPLINMSNSGPNAALRYIVFNGINLDCVNVSGGDGCVGTSPAGGVETDHITWQNYEAKNTNSTNGLPGGFAPAHIINGNFHTFRNCNVHDNGLTPVPVDGFGGYAFYINGDDHVIDNCLLYNNGGNGVQIFKSGTTNGANRITLSNSKIYHNHLNSTSTTAGVILGSGAGHRIFNNEIYDNFDGIDVDYTCTDCVIANNTVYANRAQGIFLSTTVVRPVVINNVFANSATFNIGDIGATAPTYTTNRCAGTGGTANCTTSGTVASLLLTNVSAVPPNFRPLSGSPLINTGTPVAGVTTDLIGTPRPQGILFDIGAYEFISSAFVPVVTIVNPTSNATLGVTSPLFSLGGTSNLP